MATWYSGSGEAGHEKATLSEDGNPLIRVAIVSKVDLKGMYACV